MAVLSSHTLKTFLLSLAISQLTSAQTTPPPFQCPSATTLLSPSPTCAASSLSPLPSDPYAFRPWTHEPYCLHPADKPLLGFCLFTNAEFHGGMSVVTLPEIAAVMANRTGMWLAPPPQHSTVRLWEDGSGPVVGGDEQARAHGEVVERKFEERAAPGKGRGLFVREGQSVRAGEVLFVEYPTLLIARDAIEVLLPEERYRMNWLSVGQLGEKGRKVVRGLWSEGKYADELDNVVAMNSLGVQYGGFRHLATFPQTAKINHACIPNTYYRFDEKTLSLSIFALRDIPAGEELTYTYVDPLSEAPHKDRQPYLASQWEFTCTCPLCATPSSRDASDRRRGSIRDLKAQLAEAAQDPPRIVRACKKLLALYEEEGMVAPRAMTAEIAAYAANQVGDAEGAARFGAVARGYWEVMAGKGSAEVRRLEELIRDPRGHGSYKDGGGYGGLEDEEEEGKEKKKDEGGEGDALADAVRAAMEGARKAAREGGKGEDELVEEAVRAVLRGALSRDEL
ncbi:uncharacterized protein DNG_06759 [Cephalotrichum gorgonifer]|uniref:SET domain-containing protein n=1 Tax=Cephalotrichum gorgonifer TaxID=2041049 RepID=A0AAE8N0D4_9PEZI|nr:uncharacterized protein DNG_06759 [Cephalotrichum gorgonifer]